MPVGKDAHSLRVSGCDAQMPPPACWWRADELSTRVPANCCVRPRHGLMYLFSYILGASNPAREVHSKPRLPFRSCGFGFEVLVRPRHPRPTIRLRWADGGGEGGPGTSKMTLLAYFLTLLPFSRLIDAAQCFFAPFRRFWRVLLPPHHHPAGTTRLRVGTVQLVVGRKQGPMHFWPILTFWTRV